MRDPAHEMGGSRSRSKLGHFGCVALPPASAGLKNVMVLNLGLTPQALCLRLLRRLKSNYFLNGGRILRAGFSFLRPRAQSACISV